jgi:hypothetical protein
LIASPQGEELQNFFIFPDLGTVPQPSMIMELNLQFDPRPCFLWCSHIVVPRQQLCDFVLLSSELEVLFALLVGPFEAFGFDRPKKIDFLSQKFEAILFILL